MDLFVAGFARWTWVQSNEQKQICANCCTFKMDACAFVIFSLSDQVPTCLKAVPQTSHLFSLLPRVPFLSPHFLANTETLTSQFPHLLQLKSFLLG